MVVLVVDVNHATVAPSGGVAVNCNVPVPHLVAPKTVGDNGDETMETTTGVLVADTHPEAVILPST